MHIQIALFINNYVVTVSPNDETGPITSTYDSLEQAFMYISSAMIEHGYYENEFYSRSNDDYDIDQYEVHHIIDNNITHTKPIDNDCND